MILFVGGHMPYIRYNAWLLTFNLVEGGFKYIHTKIWQGFERLIVIVIVTHNFIKMMALVFVPTVFIFISIKKKYITEITSVISTV